MTINKLLPKKISYTFPKRANMNFYLRVLGVAHFIDERLYVSYTDCCRGRHSRSLYDRLEDYEIQYYAKKGYRRMIKMFHPDNHNQDKQYYAGMIQQFTDAYDGVHRLLRYKRNPLLWVYKK